MIEITLNGEATRIGSDITIAALLEQMQMLNQRIAVEVNREIVPRSEHNERALQAGDQVEIVQAIGGG